MVVVVLLAVGVVGACAVGGLWGEGRMSSRRERGLAPVAPQRNESVVVGAALAAAVDGGPPDLGQGASARHHHAAKNCGCM